MEKQFQVTIFSKKYKPISTVIKIEESTEVKEIQKKGIVSICMKKRWSYSEMKKYGYCKIQVREYDIEKIAKEKMLKDVLKKYREKKLQNKEERG